MSDGETRARLARMYAECEIRADRADEVDSLYVSRLADNQDAYRAVGDELGIPWWFVAVVHGLESGFDFRCHLHNGDPLTERTVRTPAGRPEAGEPPFTWHESALDALRSQGLDGLEDWSVGAALDRLERYNGLGYRKRGLPSPYLWSFSGHYVQGKYVADGELDLTAVSKQCGGGTLIRRLEDWRIIDTRWPPDGDAGAGAGADGASSAARPARRGRGSGRTRYDALLASDYREYVEAEIDFPGEVVRGQRDRGEGVGKVRRVQEWLTLTRSATAVDGEFGPATEAAVRDFQRRSGLPPTGKVGAGTWTALTAAMRSAVGPVPIAGSDSFQDAVFAVARLHLSMGPMELTVRGERSSGPWVRLYMHGREGGDQPWGAGFVCHVIAQAAHAMGRPESPIPRRAGVGELVEDAIRDGRFRPGRRVGGKLRRLMKLTAGAIFVARGSRSNDWLSVGIVTAVGREAFATIEGNTNDHGAREGHDVCARSRSFAGKGFIFLD